MTDDDDDDDDDDGYDHDNGDDDDVRCCESIFCKTNIQRGKRM